MDQDFVKSLLEGLTRLPNLQQVLIQAKSKDPSVNGILSAFKQANIFPVYQFNFQKIWLFISLSILISSFNQNKIHKK